MIPKCKVGNKINSRANYLAGVVFFRTNSAQNKYQIDIAGFIP